MDTHTHTHTHRSSLEGQRTRMRRSYERILHKRSGQWRTWKSCANVMAPIAGSPSSHFRCVCVCMSGSECIQM